MQINRRLGKGKWGRLKRHHLRVRKKVAGSGERPRLMIRKTNKHIYAIVIDDSTAGGSRTLLSVSTNRKGADHNKCHCNMAKAKELGTEVGNVLKEKGVSTVVFDRGGYRYHGVVKSLCDAVREAGVQV